MIGGFKSSSLAIAAVAGFSLGSIALSPAQAADLGGDCCADLEERVAELEATTVRKGNRKLSLTLSGHVNQAIVYFDEQTAGGGGDSDVYVVDNGNSQTRFRLKGAAKFKPGWEAGIYIELGVRDSISLALGPDDDDNDASILIRHANWYMKSPLGRIQVGQGSEATDGIGEIDLSGSSIIGYANGESLLSLNNFGINEYFSGDGARNNNVRYDTPTLAGFTLSASWGEDDRWATAARYAGEFNGLRVAAGVGYTWTNDEFDPTAAAEIETQDANGNTINAATNEGVQQELSFLSASASIWHVPTGLFVTAAYNTTVDADGINAAAAGNFDAESYYIKAGLRRRFVPLGQTIVYGEYGYSESSVALFDASDPDTGAFVGFQDGDVEFFGFGLVQRISAAATELYIGYRHFENIGGLTDAEGDGNELDYVAGGARIKF